MLSERVAQQIKALRLSKGWSQDTLAKKCVPTTVYQQIDKLESGERRLTLDWLERLANALEVEVSDLIAQSAPPLREMSEQVSIEMARILGRVVLDGSEPDPGNVQVLALMLRELSQTFSRHPQAFSDPEVARPVLDMTARLSAPLAS